MNHSSTKFIAKKVIYKPTFIRRVFFRANQVPIYDFPRHDNPPRETNSTCIVFSSSSISPEKQVAFLDKPWRQTNSQ
jgi:hypothetical protein